MALSRYTGMLLSLPTLTNEQRLYGETAAVDGDMDGGMNGRMDGEIHGAVNGGMDGHSLLKVKHVCVETLLKKENECPPPCLFGHGEQGGEGLLSLD